MSNMSRLACMAILAVTTSVASAFSTCASISLEKRLGAKSFPQRGANALSGSAPRPHKPGPRRLRSTSAAAIGLHMNLKAGELFSPDGSGFNAASAEEFLDTYWQKKPLLLRKALPFESPVSPDELAGLAMEEDVKARLIVEWGALAKQVNSSYAITPSST